MASFKALQKYNIKRSLRKVALTGTAAVLLFAGCEKDPVQPDKPQKPTTYTYYYGTNGIPKDTIMAHTDVDTFYVLPTEPTLFATMPESIIHELRNHLDNATRMNPKTHGLGSLKARNANNSDSTWLSDFGYNVYRNHQSNQK